LTGPDQGFLLLTSTLGDPLRKPLTVAQFRKLARKMLDADRDMTDRDLEITDLLALGYDMDMAQRIYGLLGSTGRLREYLRRAEACDCFPITRLNPAYPVAVHQRLGLDSPGVLWAKGDVTLLNHPAVAVIGSRELNAENREFAEEAGRQIAKQGYILVSGNARGADQCAQKACLEAGGCVISVVADSLQKQPLTERMLYLSLDGFDSDFSPQRALHRNHVIHSLAGITVAAQCTLGKGGTWDGILTNLKYGWNPVYIFADGSESSAELQNRGVQAISVADIKNLAVLHTQNTSFLPI
jgi:predicted Rossmann fold nucleotide-binding protein DprA/Smf involved in DNA uptake